MLEDNDTVKACLVTLGGVHRMWCHAMSPCRMPGWPALLDKDHVANTAGG